MKNKNKNDWSQSTNCYAMVSYKAAFLLNIYTNKQLYITPCIDKIQGLRSMTMLAEVGFTFKFSRGFAKSLIIQGSKSDYTIKCNDADDRTARKTGGNCNIIFIY